MPGSFLLFKKGPWREGGYKLVAQGSNSNTAQDPHREKAP